MGLPRLYLINQRPSDRAQIVAACFSDIHESFAEAELVYLRFRSLIEHDPPPTLGWIEWWPISDN